MERAIVDAASAALEPHAHEIVSAYLFGSVARGTTGARSDVDLTVLLKDASTRALADFDLTFELELKLKRSVDLVHAYAKVDPEMVAQAATRDVQDLLEFGAAVRQALKLSPNS